MERQEFELRGMVTDRLIEKLQSIYRDTFRVDGFRSANVVR